MTYVLVGVETKRVIAERDYKSELNRERMNQQPNEPTTIIPKDKLEQALKPESVEELRNKYYAVDYWQRQLGETTKAYHGRLAAQVRKLIEKGYTRDEVLLELSINTGLLRTIQTEYSIEFKKRSVVGVVARRRKRMVELLKSGMTVKEVAESFGKSVDAVQEAARLNNFKLPRGKNSRSVPHRLESVNTGETIDFETATKAADYMHVSRSKLWDLCLSGESLNGYRVIRLDKQGVK